nr:reverse transcriptase domain-containing protein [Tanacetum cinerariifolium]
MVEEESLNEKGEVAVTEEVSVNPSFPNQLVTIDRGISKAGKDQLKCLLKNNMGVFAWEPSDMTGVLRRVIEHALNVNPSLDTVCQKWITFSMEKSMAVVNEGDETWRMCIDFKILNSAFPKDYYPLSNTDCKVESVMGFKYTCFLDAYKGYQQIQMAKEDEEKKAFYTDQGTYCYTKLPFDLNNTGATYQRLVDLTFQSQIGRNLEAYVDDMVIKSREEKMLFADISETFEMQSLSGKLAALNRFIAKSAKRTLNEAKRNYTPMEKLALALIHMTRRLRRYFEAHPVKVITDQPIKNILNNTETSGKLAKYVIELGVYNITFVHCNAVKGPGGFPLRDFVHRWSLWIKRIGGMFGSDRTSGIEYTYALRLTFSSTNNEAEYEALLAGLRIACRMNISNIEVKVDSKLVASQINGSYETSKDSMMKYLAKAKEYAYGFKSFSIKNIPRNTNQKANVLSKLASVAFNHLTKEANYVIREIHIGSCGMHVGPRAKVRKAIIQGYYWPTMHKDAKKEVEKCDSCQIHTDHGFEGFWENCRFGLPRIIIIDNEKQLVNDPFKSWCGRFEIYQMNTTVAHPQANELVERANRSLMEGIKTRLGREKARWVDELQNVLWAHRTSIKQSNGENPLSLTYGSKAVIPAEIGIPTYQTLMIREGYNKEEMRLNLDLLQERREADAIREANYKTKFEQYYNKKVRPTGFRPGEFMFRRNEASMVEDQGKLGPMWERPYRVIEAYENGSYKLQTLEDKKVPRTWHAINLCKC